MAAARKAFGDIWQTCEIYKMSRTLSSTKREREKNRYEKFEFQSLIEKSIVIGKPQIVGRRVWRDHVRFTCINYMNYGRSTHTSSTAFTSCHNTVVSRLGIEFVYYNVRCDDRRHRRRQRGFQNRKLSNFADLRVGRQTRTTAAIDMSGPPVHTTRTSFLKKFSSEFRAEVACFFL